ncbi:MAG TPA: hypothetical protein VEK11_02110 [Thermoanaerobaculia bacterium]|nr:hypothetical protein [Thermoanaerobaculia bacterium]
MRELIASRDHVNREYRPLLLRRGHHVSAGEALDRPDEARLLIAQERRERDLESVGFDDVIRGGGDTAERLAAAVREESLFD